MSEKYNYKTFDDNLDVVEFINMATQVWPGKYQPVYTSEALRKTINTTAWDNDKLIGCVRVLTDGYFFSTITEILVLPEYQRKGVGEKLMALAFETSPTSLYFGAQAEAVGFYEKIGYEKSIQSFCRKKLLRQ